MNARYRTLFNGNWTAVVATCLLFASTASVAHAQYVDLIWDTNSTVLDVAAPGETHTLYVVLTAGPSGVSAFGVSVDYGQSPVPPSFFVNAPDGLAPFLFAPATTTDLGGVVSSFNAATFTTGLSLNQEFLAGYMEFTFTTVPSASCIEIFPFFAPTVDGIFDNSQSNVSFDTTLSGALACGTSSGGGGDVGVDATKLVIIDKLAAADKAKVVFVAKDQTNGITKGMGTDPDLISATVDISYTGTAGQFSLPQGALSGDSGWATNKESVAKFVNKAAPGGPTAAKVAVVKPGKLLKLVGKSLGDTAIDLQSGGPDAAGVDVAYTVVNDGTTTRHCTNFALDACVYKPIAAGTGRKLVCKNGTPAACP